MYPVQQQSTLPYDPSQQQFAFINLSGGVPCPRIQSRYPEIQNAAPTIAAHIAWIIQTKAHETPLRMFMFNQFARDAFNNSDFAAVVELAADFIALSITGGVYPNIEQAIQIGVTNFIDLLCASNVQAYPELERFITQQQAYASQKAIIDYGQVRAAINNFRGGMQPQQNFMQHPQMNNSFNNRNIGVASYGAPMQVGNNSMLFNNGQNSMAAIATTAAQATGKTMGGNKYDNVQVPLSPAGFIQQPFVGRTIIEATPVETKTVEVIEPNEIQIKDKKWIPSTNYPYFPVYDTFKNEIVYMKDEANPKGLIPTAKVRNTNMMEYDRHLISTVFGPVPKNMNITPPDVIEKRLHVAIDKMNQETGDFAPEIKTVVKNGTIAEISLAAAWFEGAISRKTTDKILPDVYRVYARISEPFIACVDESQFITEFGKSKTFIELREKMDSSVNEVTPALWTAANLRMTDLINRVIKSGLAIPGLAIESFVTDIQDLIDLLDKKYGHSVQKAFLSKQAKQINSVFQLMYQNEAEELTSMYLDGHVFPEGCEPKITYLASDYSLTYINCMSFELNIDLLPNIGCEITDQFTPALHKLLVGLFDETDSKINTFDRHLIKTSDNRVLEATRGLIGDDFYLLTLIN